MGGRFHQCTWPGELGESRMASKFNLHTKAPKVATLFDYMAPEMTNLKMGAPGETMLKKCAEAMKKAAVYRMVCTGGGG